jgi:hypothetical protein
MRDRCFLACLWCLCASGCSGSSPAPTPVYPNVAGTYAGTATYTTTTITVSCAANTAVSQAGNRVNISAIQLGAECGTGVIPGGQFTISTTGALEGITSSTVTDAGCQGTYNVSGSGGFFDRELRLTFTYTSSTAACVLRGFTTTMTR